MTETDTWTTGGSSVESTYDINGNAGDTRTVRLYRAADCYVGGSDIGYGSYDAPTQTVGCVRDKGDNTRTALTLSPETPGSTVVEGVFSSVWNNVSSGGPLSNTCTCGDNIDNGFAASWEATLNGTTPVTLKSRYAFVTAPANATRVRDGAPSRVGT